MTKKELTPAEQNNCIQILKERFEKNMHRHQDLDWQKIEERIINQPEKIWSLHQMEYPSNLMKPMMDYWMGKSYEEGLQNLKKLSEKP